MKPVVWRHEWALLSVEVLLASLLALRMHPAALQMVALLVVHLAVIVCIRPGTRVTQWVRLASAYPVALVLYRAFSVVTPALGLPLQDAHLLALDRALFGETPAVRMQGWHAPWLTELMSACYLAYHAYLHGALLLESVKPLERALRVFDAVFIAFAVGYVGYLLVPATGPAEALFSTRIEGGAITRINAEVVARGGAVFDAFPSLHVLITLVLLAQDWRNARARCLAMVPVTTGLVLSTMYLRYHYAVDLVAGVVLFAMVETFVRRRPPCHGGSGGWAVLRGSSGSTQRM